METRIKELISFEENRLAHLNEIIDNVEEIPYELVLIARAKKDLCEKFINELKVLLKGGN